MTLAEFREATKDLEPDAQLFINVGGYIYTIKEADIDSDGDVNLKAWT